MAMTLVDGSECGLTGINVWCKMQWNHKQGEIEEIP